MATIKLGEFSLRQTEIALRKRSGELLEMLDGMESVDCPKTEDFWRNQQSLQFQLKDCEHALEIVHMALVWKR